MVSGTISDVMLRACGIRRQVGLSKGLRSSAQIRDLAVL
jgi:hypothetical protein